MSKHRSEKRMLSPEQLAQAAGEIAEHAESEHVDVARRCLLRATE
jgi:hypothetical protein